MDSPVMRDSSQTLSPATTFPSTGILDPERKYVIIVKQLRVIPYTVKKG
jgi:hypothetical protein